MSNVPVDPGNSEAVPPVGSNAQFMKEFEKLIHSYADAVSKDKPQEAHNAAMQALLMAGEEALRNPTPSLLLKQEAADCEASGDWSGAETAYRKVLAMEETSGNFGMLAKAHMDLCVLLRTLARLDEASQFAAYATDAARRTQIFPVLVRALELQSFCALDRGDVAMALTSASEALQVIEPGKMFMLMRAKALITRARCEVAADQTEAADSDLASSWELLQARASPVTPGPLLALAYWWEVKGRLGEHRGNLPRAREAMTRAIEYFRQLNGPYAMVAVARALQQLSKVLGQTGDSLSAERASAEAKAIRSELHLPATR